MREVELFQRAVARRIEVAEQALVVGAGAGWVATSHTLGYGLCAMLVPLVSQIGISVALLVTAFVAAALFTGGAGVIWFSRRRSPYSVI